MKKKTKALLTGSLAAAVALGLVFGGVGQARAGETVSDDVVNSLLLRAAKTQAPLTKEQSSSTESLPLAVDGSKAPAWESFVNLERLKGLGVAGLILGGAALLVFGAWRNGWRLKPRGSHGSPIRLVSTKPLGDKKAIAVVDVEGHRLVVGMTSHQVTLLTSLPSRTEEPQGRALEEEREPSVSRGSRWTPPPRNFEFGQTSYPDIQGIMSAMRG